MLGSSNKTPLSVIVQALSLAAARANERIHTEYINTVTKLKENGQDTYLSIPPPLSISNAKISFSAHVSKADRTKYEEFGDDILLDFGKSGGNFHGEIQLQAYDPESPEIWHAGSDALPSSKESQPPKHTATPHYTTDD